MPPADDDPPYRPRFNDVRDDFDDEYGVERTPEEIAKRRLLIPAIAYVAIGVLGILISSLLLVWLSAGPRWSYVKGYNLVIGVSLVGIGYSAVVIAGGIGMFRRQGYRIAVVATFLVMLTAAVGCYGVIAFPFGIYAMILLMRPETRRLFGRPPLDDSPELARRRLRIPSLAMIWIGIILVPAAILGGVILAIYPFQEHVNDLEMIALISALVLSPFVIGFMVWVAFSGWHMRNLRRRKSALVAAYFVTCFSLVPFYGLAIFPFGVWALVWLHHPDVRKHFSQFDPAMAQQPGAALRQWIREIPPQWYFLTGGLGLTTILIFVAWDFWEYYTSNRVDEEDLFWWLLARIVGAMLFLAILVRGWWIRASATRDSLSA